MIKITIETETPSDIRALIESFMNNNHSGGCKHHKTQDELFVCERGAGPVVLTPTATHSIAAPDTSNITLTCTGSGSTPANKQEISSDVVKKVISMSGTTISTCNEPKQPKYRTMCCANCSKLRYCPYRSVRITKEIPETKCSNWWPASEDDLKKNEEVFAEYISKVKELKA